MTAYAALILDSMQKYENSSWADPKCSDILGALGFMGGLTIENPHSGGNTT